jgi:hypothetical protein
MADLVIVELCTLIDDSSLDSKIREDLDVINEDTWTYNDAFNVQYMMIAAIKDGVASLWQGDWSKNGKLFNALEDAGRVVLSEEEFDVHISNGCMRPCGRELQTIKVSGYEC